MKKFNFKSIYAFSFIALLALVLAACGNSESTSSKSNDTSSKESTSSETAEKPKGTKEVLRVGTSGIYPPFVSKNEDGELEGYDVDVLTLIGEKIGYEIEWTVAEFAGLFGMMESGRIDTVANLIAKTEERVEKYDFSDPYAYYSVTLVVKDDRDDIQSLEDMKGKSLGALLGNNMHNFAQKWNEENGNEIEIRPYQDVSGTYNEVALGRIDAFIDSNFVALSRIKEEKLPLKLFSETPLYTTENAFPFVKSAENEEFIKEFNVALQELKDDGTLKELSDKWSEVDVTKP